MNVLVLNIGSSSIKSATFEMREALTDSVCLGRNVYERHARLTPDETIEDLDLVGRIIDQAERTTSGAPLSTVGHRVVHSGRIFARPARIYSEIVTEIASLATLAPLHQPHNLAGILAMQKLRPNLPQIACFDTSFHRSQPEIQRRYALPEECFEAGIERYGFHGLSYDWLVRRIRRLRGELPRRLLAFHLESGSSACAILDGQSQACSMGFSTIDGLMMGTRAGALDVGVILHWLAQGKSRAEIADILYTKSGLLGVSGQSSDMRTLLRSDEPAAARTVEMFCLRAAATGASLVTSMGGLDAIAFTGGIGENSAEIRTRVVSRLGHLGVSLAAGESEVTDGLVSAPDSKVEVWIVPADEERIIAEETFRLLGLP